MGSLNPRDAKRLRTVAVNNLERLCTLEEQHLERCEEKRLTAQRLIDRRPQHLTEDRIITLLNNYYRLMEESSQYLDSAFKAQELQDLVRQEIIEIDRDTVIGPTRPKLWNFPTIGDE